RGQALIGERLHQVATAADSIALGDVGGIIRRTHYHYWNPAQGCVPLDLLQNHATIVAGKIEVQENERREGRLGISAAPEQIVEGLPSRATTDNLTRQTLPQRSPHRIEILITVFHDQQWPIVHKSP